MKKLLLILFLSNFIFSCWLKGQLNNTPVKNVILLIGDGMGLAQVHAAFTINKGFLNLNRASYIGLSRTASANNYITDSGAGATAISTGQKTNNYSIGIDTAGKPLKTILESFEEKAYSTGMVVTCPLTHATPAAFISHAQNRSEVYNIAASFIESGIDVFMGGGRLHFEARPDSINLSDKLRDKGYQIVYDIKQVSASGTEKIGCFAADDKLPAIYEGRGNFLEQATQKALSGLKSNEKGFFLMIEGSQIDWGGHANNIPYMIDETIDFDKAVGIAFTFADKNPGTLVVVTADHETGGLALLDGNIEKGLLEGNFATINHTGVMVPVYAYGAGANVFAGIYENTAIYFKIMHLLKWCNSQCGEQNLDENMTQELRH